MPGQILYNNLLTLSTTTFASTNEAVGYESVNLSNWNSYDSYRQASVGTGIINIDLGSLMDVDSFAIFGHSIFDAGGSFDLQWSNDGSTGWTVVGSATPTDNNVIFFSFASVSKRYWRIFNITTTGVASIAVAFLGEKMTLEKGFRVGHMPTGLFDDAMTIQNVSETGLPLGRSLIVRPGKFTIPQTLLTPAWVRSDWIPFIEHTKSFPFFFAWDLTGYPEETVLAWTNGKKIEQPKYSHSARMSAMMKINCQKSL